MTTGYLSGTVTAHPETTHRSAAEVGGAGPRRAAAARPRNRRQNAALTITATVLGLWFGLAAPSVSPVAPTTPVAVSPATVNEVAGPVAPVDPTRGRLDDFGQHGRHQ